MDDVVLCGATISFGDDYGDNFSTFRCDVGKGHAGFHQEGGVKISNVTFLHGRVTIVR